MNEQHQSHTHFDHDRLDVSRVLLEALAQGVHIANLLPRGFGPLADQLRRALQGAWLQMCEAAARAGQDRANRFRMARAEANEAAGALQAIERLSLAPSAEVTAVLELLGRSCAMLTMLSRVRR